MSVATNATNLINRIAVCLAVSACVTAWSVGCSKPNSTSGTLDPHLQVLTRLYVDHLNRMGGTPPANQQAFEEFIRDRGMDRLKDAGTENIADLFISTRDQEPLVVFYGKASDPRLQGDVVAYEQTGVDGKRCVGLRYGTVQLVGEDEFNRLVTHAP